MDAHPLPTEIIVNHPRSSLGSRYLDWDPHPGDYLEIDAQTYLVLERRRRYALTANRYQLARIALYVQPSAGCD